MPRLLLIALLLFAALYALPKLLAAFKELDGSKRRRIAGGTLGLLGATLVIVVLARFGLQWLGVVGAALWATFRTLAPWLLRLLPLGHRFRQQWGRAERSAPDEPSSASHEGNAARPSPRAGMSRPEALEVLGLAEGASEQQILHAYRSLMRKVHPDSPGGSGYLATKLNQAKDVLLS